MIGDVGQDVFGVTSPPPFDTFERVMDLSMVYLHIIFPSRMAHRSVLILQLASLAQCKPLRRD